MPTAPAREVVGWARAVEAPRLRDSRHLGLAVDLPRRLHDAGALRGEHRAHPARPARHHARHAASRRRRLRGGDAGGARARAHDARASAAATAPRTTSGLKPVSLTELREYTQTIRRLLTTGRADYHGTTARFTWSRATGADLPRRLRAEDAAPRRPDRRRRGDPDRHRARHRARLDRADPSRRARRPGAIPRRSRCGGGRTRTSRRAAARRSSEIKMSLASAGNHLSRFTTEGKHIPPDLLAKVKILGERYAFGDHVQPGSAQLPAHRGAGAGRLPRRPVRDRRDAGRVHQDDRARRRRRRAPVLDQHPLRRQAPLPARLGRPGHARVPLSDRVGGAARTW